MKKRKVLIEKNSEHKESFSHPSATNLRFTSTNRQGRERSVKLPSIQNLHNSSFNKVAKFNDDRMVLPDEMQPPKTRFRSKSKETRLTSSPRLKSFPVEEIKKLNNPPLFSPQSINALMMHQDPRENETFYTNYSARNNGHGDTISIPLHAPYQRAKSDNINTTSQQQVVANHQEICQTNPHSESSLTRRIASPEHRSFVQNIPQRAVVYDQPFQNSSTIINQPIMTQIDQNRNESSTFDNRCQKPSICDRNAANNRQVFKQTASGQIANTSRSNQSLGNCQNVYHNQLYVPFQQNLHRVNQQTQRNTYSQQMLPQTLHQVQSPAEYQPTYNNSGIHCSRYNQQLPISQGFEQGMTSPQDMTINQMRLMRHNLPIHQKNLAYPVNFQSTRSQNDEWMQMMNKNQHLCEPSPPRWQYYYQPCDTNLNRQNSENQTALSQNQKNQKPTSHSAMQLQQEEKKTLKFTPNMIRDQELLVSTMRQQGVPEEIMRRQFDALLNEQKRHLAYVAQFQQQESDIPEKIKKVRLSRRRTEKDEKPEWMIHITPPRISYSDLERIKVQQKVLNEQCPMNDKLEKMNKAVTGQQSSNYEQLKKEELSNPLPQQMHVQINPYQLCPPTNWPYRSDRQMSYSHTTCYPYNHQQNISNNMYPSSNYKYTQYPHSIRYNPYFSHTEPQKLWSKEYNPNLPNPIDQSLNQKSSIDSSYFYQPNKPETSSLLKMRIYKEVICPQKRNNGLQDPDSIQKMLEALKDPTNRKGLEYLANLAKKKPAIKLNGIQNSNEIPNDMQPCSETVVLSQKKISANGLENSRNPNNPLPRILRPNRADESLMAEYPRQRQNIRNCYSMQAEKDSNMIATLQNQDVLSQNAYESIPYDRQNTSIAQGYHGNNIILQSGENIPYQMQQYYHNKQNLSNQNGGQGDVAYMQQSDAPGGMKIDRAGGDTGEKFNVEETMKRIGNVQTMQGTNAFGQPEICETRTIGGITYLTRKPECTFNKPIGSPEKLIVSEHV